MAWTRWMLGLGLAATLGCQSFPILTGNADPKGDKDFAASGAPTKNSLRVSQFVFHADFELAKAQPLFKELSGLREQVFKELQLPPSTNLVQVYLFEDREKYEQYMKTKYPELPKRRAFFVAQPKRIGGAEDLLVYTYWGERINQDLRHELTHAMLHSVLKDVPLWLDEGLAEYFEMPPAWNGVNYQHVENLRTAKFDLDRLEKLNDVQQMTPAEYRESWAWTHLMLRTTPQAKQTLLAYLQELRSNSRPSPLRSRLAQVHSAPEAALNRHVAALELGREK